MSAVGRDPGSGRSEIAALAAVCDRSDQICKGNIRGPLTTLPSRFARSAEPGRVQRKLQGGARCGRSTQAIRLPKGAPERQAEENQGLINGSCGR